MYKTIGLLCEGLGVDAFLLWKSLFKTPRPWSIHLLSDHALTCQLPAKLAFGTTQQ